MTDRAECMGTAPHGPHSFNAGAHCPGLGHLAEDFAGDVHTRHCCSAHGCKYGSPDCTVMAGAAQEFPCEQCQDDAPPFADRLLDWPTETHLDGRVLCGKRNPEQFGVICGASLERPHSARELLHALATHIREAHGDG